MSRFADFDDNELRALWDGLTMDDGIRYGLMSDDTSTEAMLVREAYAEARRRGDMTNADERRWRNVL